MLNAQFNAGKSQASSLVETNYDDFQPSYRTPRLTTTILILVLGVLLASPLAKGIVTEILGFAKAGVRDGVYHVTVPCPPII